MMERVFHATDEALSEALAYVEEQLERYDCPMRTVMQITVCVEEMFINVAHYAYPDGTGMVTINLDLENGMFSITFIDEGVPFDPLKKEDPDITLSADDREIGGLGIFMVKKSMNEVSYEYKDGKNVFTMKKKIF